MDIIFDIDGTVANLDHRLGLVKNHPKDYVAFEAAISEDSVIEPVKTLFSILVDFHNVLFASGRSERCREETEEWLWDNGFAGYDKLYMRPSFIKGTDRKDTRPDTVIKAEILEQMWEDGYDPKICFDDRLNVVKQWPKLGVFCFCVNQGILDY